MHTLRGTLHFSRARATLPSLNGPHYMQFLRFTVGPCRHGLISYHHWDVATGELLLGGGTFAPTCTHRTGCVSAVLMPSPCLTDYHIPSLPPPFYPNSMPPNRALLQSLHLTPFLPPAFTACHASLFRFLLPGYVWDLPLGTAAPPRAKPTMPVLGTGRTKTGSRAAGAHAPVPHALPHARTHARCAAPRRLRLRATLHAHTTLLRLPFITLATCNTSCLSHCSCLFIQPRHRLPYYPSTGITILLPGVTFMPPNDTYHLHNRAPTSLRT